jgi:hypothetical protein
VGTRATTTLTILTTLDHHRLNSDSTTPGAGRPIARDAETPVGIAALTTPHPPNGLAQCAAFHSATTPPPFMTSTRPHPSSVSCSVKSDGRLDCGRERWTSGQFQALATLVAESCPQLSSWIVGWLDRLRAGGRRLAAGTSRLMAGLATRHQHQHRVQSEREEYAPRGAVVGSKETAQLDASYLLAG